MSKAKKVTWRTVILENIGLRVESYLNDGNFQPGKFFILDGDVPHTVKIVYVEKEEQL